MSQAPAPLLRLPPRVAVWRVAWPMVLLGWVRALYLIADTWWVGHLGTAELTALGVASFGWWILDQLSELAGTGVHSLSARREGEGRRDAVGEVLAHGALVALVLWGVAILGGQLLVPLYLDAMGVIDPVVRHHTTSFLTAATLAWVGLFAQGIVSAVFRGLGHSRAALTIAALGCVVNAALDPVLIWGGFGVPGMGVAGAAWATGIAALLSACVGLAVLAKDGIVPRLPSVDRATIADIVKIGAPISMTGIAFSGVYVVLGRLIVRFGETNMGALGLGHRLESFVYLASTGFAVAAATLVGQNLGAKDAEGARRSVEITARNCTVFMVVGGLVAFVFADTLVASFTPDPVVRAAAAVYLRVQATIWVGMGFEMVYEGAFAGAGYTTPPMWIIGVLTAARVPLAWALAVGLDMGVVGVWVAVALSTLIKGLLLRAWWARGTWATRAGLPAPTG